jgi:hypothetical protein
MNPMREMSHKPFAKLLNCPTEDDYRQKKGVLLDYLRRTQPHHFILKDGRRRSFQRMAEMEGCTIEEKLEDLVDGVIAEHLYYRT